MRHPFAVQIPRPQSLFSLRNAAASPDTKEAPQPRKPKRVETPPPVPPRTPILQLGPLVPNRSLSPLQPTKADASGHFVRHSSKLTLLLSGQRDGACVPSYSSGETIEGVLAIARPSGVLALDVKIEGTILIQEIAGAGSVTVKTIDEKIYSWAASSSGSFPPRAAFRYTLPSTYRDSSGKRYLLPPTFAADLHGIPGFYVKVDYAVVVNLTLLREASTLWRGVSNVCVPFRYVHRTRPTLAGPFPVNPTHTETRPRTLFVYRMRSVRGDAPGIKVHVRTVCSFRACGPRPC
ncbi:hypothetical protein C8Q76DRAFT_476666 [Earliella scabrosa]|nr:hypothetical protein C8Q76DRAFT_476666 [Earliella scabrosa]